MLAPSMNATGTIFWAKTTKEGLPGISVRDHCLNVGCVAEALIDPLPPAARTLLPSGAATLAALHDVGKITLGLRSLWMSTVPILHQPYGQRSPMSATTCRLRKAPTPGATPRTLLVTLIPAAWKDADLPRAGCEWFPQSRNLASPNRQS